MSHDFLVRPMREADVAAVEALSGEVFLEHDRTTRRVHDPEPQPRSPERREAWTARLTHFLRHDAGGCWVAEDDAGVLGAAISIKREGTWVLATFVVRTQAQGRGVGRPLLEAAQTHGRGCLRAMLVASDDPRATRSYRRAGFDLHPAMAFGGRVDRRLLPAVERVREGGPGDVDQADSVDRRVREAAHGVDHQFLLSRYRMVVTDHSTGEGYAYVAPHGGPLLLAATNRRTAARLLWETLAASTPDVPVELGPVTAQNGWALDVGFGARLSLRLDSYLGLRGMKPPVPYLPSGHVL